MARVLETLRTEHDEGLTESESSPEKSLGSLLKYGRNRGFPDFLMCSALVAASESNWWAGEQYDEEVNELFYSVHANASGRYKVQSITRNMLSSCEQKVSQGLSVRDVSLAHMRIRLPVISRMAQHVAGDKTKDLPDTPQGHFYGAWCAIIAWSKLPVVPSLTGTMARCVDDGESQAIRKAWDDSRQKLYDTVNTFTSHEIVDPVIAAITIKLYDTGRASIFRLNGRVFEKVKLTQELLTDRATNRVSIRETGLSGGVGKSSVLGPGACAMASYHGENVVLRDDLSPGIIYSNLTGPARLEAAIKAVGDEKKFAQIKKALNSVGRHQEGARLSRSKRTVLLRALLCLVVTAGLTTLMTLMALSYDGWADKVQCAFGSVSFYVLVLVGYNTLRGQRESRIYEALVGIRVLTSMDELLTSLKLEQNEVKAWLLTRNRGEKVPWCSDRLTCYALCERSGLLEVSSGLDLAEYAGVWATTGTLAIELSNGESYDHTSAGDIHHFEERRQAVTGIHPVKPLVNGQLGGLINAE